MSTLVHGQRDASDKENELGVRKTQGTACPRGTRLAVGPPPVKSLFVSSWNYSRLQLSLGLLCLFYSILISDMLSKTRLDMCCL